MRLVELPTLTEVPTLGPEVDRGGSRDEGMQGHRDGDRPGLGPGIGVTEVTVGAAL